MENENKEDSMWLWGTIGATVGALALTASYLFSQLNSGEKEEGTIYHLPTDEEDNGYVWKEMPNSPFDHLVPQLKSNGTDVGNLGDLKNSDSDSLDEISLLTPRDEKDVS